MRSKQRGSKERAGKTKHVSLHLTTQQLSSEKKGRRKELDAPAVCPHGLWGFNAHSHHIVPLLPFIRGCACVEVGLWWGCGGVVQHHNGLASSAILIFSFPVYPWPFVRLAAHASKKKKAPRTLKYATSEGLRASVTIQMGAVASFVARRQKNPGSALRFASPHSIICLRYLLFCVQAKGRAGS